MLGVRRCLHTYSCDEDAVFHAAAQGDFGVGAGAGASVTMIEPARSGEAMNGTDTFPIATMIVFGVPNLPRRIARASAVCPAPFAMRRARVEDAQEQLHSTKREPGHD
ncbi:MAG TPA: hypothetical protein VMV99_11075 [Rhodanobacter sp.]|nr:hypothetical protein [Rhodanobacter sp.]